MLPLKVGVGFLSSPLVMVTRKKMGFLPLLESGGRLGMPLGSPEAAPGLHPWLLLIGSR
jgi:hypothetical protein